MPLAQKRIPTGFPGPQRAEVKSFPPPMRGMNTAAPLVAMGPDEALLLDNWMITQYGVTVRDGWATFCENLGSTHHIVRTIIPSPGKNSVPNFDDPYVVPGPGKMFGCTDDGIYDCTVSSAAPPLKMALSGTLAAGQFSYTAYSIEGGLFIAACSETDGYHIYNTATNTWSKVLQDMTDPPAAGKIFGADPGKFCFVLAFKKRLVFVERDTGNMWCLPVGVLAGTVKLFDWGPLLSKGGTVSCLATWTHDAGIGLDDHMVALGTMGDVLIYKGTDPTDVTQWETVGSWYVGAPPAGRRGMSQYGGEVGILSELGITPVSAIVEGRADLQRAKIKIRPMLAKHVRDYGGEYGWGMVEYPALGYLMINSPPGNESSRQYGFAVNFDAWNIMTMMPAACFENFNHNLYFGTEDGRVCVAFYGDLDDVARDLTGGIAILSRYIGPYDGYNAPAYNKQFHMIRPVLDARMKPQASLWINVDFKIRTDRGNPAFRPISVSRWDQDKWNSARWGGSRVPYNDWFSVDGMGRVGAVGFAMSSIAGVILYETDVIYEMTKQVFG